MATTDTLVSVVLPVYNPGRFLAAAVASILEQTHRQLELLLVDDGSTDGSGAVCDAIAASDPRVRVIHQANGGIVSALEAGIAQARGEFIARMDSDDLSLPIRLEKQLALVAQQPSLQVVGCDHLLIDPQDRVIGARHLPRGGVALDLFLAFGNPFAHPTVMMRSAWVRRFGYRAPPEHADQQVAEDLSLWVRGWQPGIYANVPEPLLRYRVHPGQISQNRWSALQRARLSCNRAHAARLATAPAPLAAQTNHQHGHSLACRHAWLGLAACWHWNQHPPLASSGGLALRVPALACYPLVTWYLHRLRRIALKARSYP